MMYTDLLIQAAPHTYLKGKCLQHKPAEDSPTMKLKTRLKRDSERMAKYTVLFVLKRQPQPTPQENNQEAITESPYQQSQSQNPSQAAPQVIQVTTEIHSAASRVNAVTLGPAAAGASALRESDGGNTTLETLPQGDEVVVGDTDVNAPTESIATAKDCYSEKSENRKTPLL